MHDKVNFGYLGVGRYLPATILTNQDLEHMVETSDEWIQQRTGIKTRHILDVNDSLLNMATEAAKEALKNSGVDKSQIRYLYVGTNTHLRFPSLASMVADQLGISQVSGADIQAGCAAYIFALENVYNQLVCDQLLTGEAGYGLVIGADAMSTVVNWKDRSTCVLFGDGAGAAVIGPVKSGGILATVTRTQGQYGSLLCMYEFLKIPNPAGDSKILSLPETASYPIFIMEGRKVFPVAVRSMMADIRAVIERYNRISGESLQLADIGYVIPHQANLRIVAAVQEGMGLTEEQVYRDGVINYGNTSAATLPLAYVDVWGKRPNTLQVDVSFGAGFSSGAILWRTPATE